MRYIEGLDRAQMVLFQESLDELVLENNPVRVIDAFVEYLDLEVLGFKKAKTDVSVAGAPSYNPKALIKLYLYGYSEKIRSSRRLMKLCITNIEVMWLIGRIEPDFRTIADFRKENAEALKKVFKEFVKLCAKLGLYNTEAAVQDGSKFRADNSKDNNITEAKLAKKMELAEEKLQKYLDEMDRLDKEERVSPKFTTVEIASKIEAVKEQIIRYNELQNEMKEKRVTQLSYTDPESKLMKSANGGFDVAYNVQIAVDPKSHMVGAVEVTDHCNDMGQLMPVITELKEDLGVDTIEVTADKGFEDSADMVECLKNGIIPHVPRKSGEESYEFEIKYKEAEITEAIQGSTKSADIQKCLEAGVLPDCYKDKGIEMSLTEKEEHITDEHMCLMLNEAGTAIICPEGNELRKTAQLVKKDRTRYVNRAACSACKNKCTTSKIKQIDLKPGQTVYYMKKRQTIIKVKIKLTPNKEKIAGRKTVAEHPFGTVKRWYDGAYTLLRGKVKVAADLSLLFLGYNLKRAINMMGVEELIKNIMDIRAITA